jgi:hypothetical protein
MNHQNNRPLAKFGTVLNPPSCRAQKATCAVISSNSDRESEFKLVVAHDDFSSANRARAFFENLVETFGEILTLIPRFLKFERLATPHVGERVARDAAAADMIVIVAYEHADLPGLVEEWMRTWESTSRIGGRRLLTLLSTSFQENCRWTRVQSRLRQLARSCGMRFVLQATAMSRTRGSAVYENPKLKQTADECRRTRSNLGDTGGLLGNTMRGAAAGGTLVDLQPTAVSNAIIEVMRLRQHKICPPTLPLAAGRRMGPPARK